MNNKFGLLQQDLDSIIDILKKQEAIEEALIFGSRAKNSYKKGSDVDIAIKGKQVNHNVINEVSYSLNEETIMPYQFDILDRNKITNHHLTQHIDCVGITIYKKK